MEKKTAGHYFWLAGVIGLMAVLVALRYDSRHGLTALIQFGADAEATKVPALADIPHHVRELRGFDGQFYAQIALDPLLRDPATLAAIDDPAYRARRILMPWAAYLVGLGQPALIIQLYPLLDLVCWGFLLWWLLRILAPIGPWQRAIITGIVLSSGTLETVRLSLTDLPATLLMLVPCIAAISPVRGALWLGLANLCRETSVLGTFAYFAGPVRGPAKPSRRALGLALALLPLAVWILYVNFRLGRPQAGGGNFSWPLFGAWGALELAVRRFTSELSPSALGAIAAIIGLHWQALHLWRQRRLDDPLWRLGALFAVLLVFLGPKVWELPLGACRSVLPMTIAFNLLLARETRPRWVLFVATNLYSLHGIYTFLTYRS